MERPIVVFDLEATGLDVVQDRIVEISCVRIEADGSTRMLEILDAIRQSGITIILIEHVMKVMREAVDTILVMDYGAEIASGKPDEVMNDKKVIEIYLGESA